MKRLLVALLAMILAAGAAACAAAEGWPDESVHDAEGKTYKQVSTGDGGLQVWVLVGVFGSPDEALVSVGLLEDEKGEEGGGAEDPKEKPEEPKPEDEKPEGSQGTGKVEIVSKPFDYEMKKTSGKEQTGAAEKQTKSSQGKTKTTRSAKYKTSKAPKSVIPLTVRSSEPEEDSSAAVQEKTKTKKTMRSKRRSRRLQTVRNMPVTSVEDIWKGSSQVYIQDNQGSGR